MDFKESVKNWVSRDNEIKTLNEKLKLLREDKKELERSICSFATHNDMKHSIIKLSDSQLSFKQVKQQTPLTLKYIKNCLHMCIDNDDHIDAIMDTIKNNREVKYVDTINRKDF